MVSGVMRGGGAAMSLTVMVIMEMNIRTMVNMALITMATRITV